MQSSAGKPWVLAFIWIPLDKHYPSTAPDSNGTPRWQWPPSRTMHPDTPQKLLRKNTTKTARHLPGLWIPQVQIWLSICGKCAGTSLRPHPPQYTGPKGSTTNVPVPDITGHPQRSYDHALTGQSCFGCTRGTCTILSRWLECCVCAVLFSQNSTQATMDLHCWLWLVLGEMLYKPKTRWSFLVQGASEKQNPKWSSGSDMRMKRGVWKVEKGRQDLFR